MISYVASELQKGDNSIVNSHIKETFKFLEWKAEKYPYSVSPIDVHITQSREYANFHYIMSQSCKYSKQMITKYTEHLWKCKVLNKASLEGKTRIPCVRALPLPIPMGISRDDEFKLMSMFYSNNLLNSFLHEKQLRNQCLSPMCPCGYGEQTAFHILANCKKCYYRVHD